MVTTASYLVLPDYLSSDEDEGQSTLLIPDDVHTLAGFRRWVHSRAFPETLRAAFLNGDVFIDMSKQDVQTHIHVKTAIGAVLPNLIESDDLGEFFGEGTLFVNAPANISTNPDALMALWESLEAGRVRLVKTKAGETELHG